MINRTLCESDDFLDLTPEAQCLYLHINLNADDEGLVNNMRQITGMVNHGEDALAELINAGYIIPILPKVYAVTHWHQHNTIAKDRYHKSKICDPKQFLDLVDGVYKTKGISKW